MKKQAQKNQQGVIFFILKRSLNLNNLILFMLSRFKTLLHCDHLPDNECFSMKKSIILKEKDGKERGMKRKEK